MAIMPRVCGVSGKLARRGRCWLRPEPDQRLALACDGGAIGLPICWTLMVLSALFDCSSRPPGMPRVDQSAACSASPASRRRACRAETLMLRRAATARGES